MIEKYFKEKYSEFLDGLEIQEDAYSIKIPKIVVKPEHRNSGLGGKIMSELVEYADNVNKVITLTPSPDYGGDINRLVQFYKKFGFKLNKGYYKSDKYTDTMIRYPKSSPDKLNENTIKTYWEKVKSNVNDIKGIASREKDNTIYAINLIKKAINNPKSITDNEKDFIKGQSTNIAKIIGVTATGAVSMLIPLTAEKILNKWGISILPKDQTLKLDKVDLNENEQKKLIKFNLRRRFGRF